LVYFKFSVVFFANPPAYEHTLMHLTVASYWIVFGLWGLPS